MSVQITIQGEHAKEAIVELVTLASCLTPRAVNPVAAPAIDQNEGKVLAVSAVHEAVHRGETVVVTPVAAIAEAPAAKPKATRVKKADAPKAAPAPEPAEVQAQDAADEEVEQEANKAESKKLTHDDVRSALGDYVEKFGMEAAQEDGPKVLKMIFGDDKAKVSQIPDTQDALQKAVDGINEMLQKNPFKRKLVVGG